MNNKMQPYKKIPSDDMESLMTNREGRVCVRDGRRQKQENEEDQILGGGFLEAMSTTSMQPLSSAPPSLQAKVHKLRRAPETPGGPLALKDDMETKTFSVVEFADDNSVEIVPTTWLEETTK